MRSDRSRTGHLLVLLLASAWIPSLAIADAELDRQLGLAVRKADTTKVAKLLKQGADPNSVDRSNCSALREAVRHPKVVKLLLAAGATVDDAAMSQAGWLNEGESLKLLLDAGGNKEAALCGAAHGGYLELVEMLLAKGADANAKSKDGASALQLAALQGGAEVVQRLLKANADPNAIDPRGQTPLRAALRGDCELATVQALVKAGAKLDTADERGLTPARYAALHAPREVYDYLLDASGGKLLRPPSDPNSPASKKSTRALLSEFQAADGQPAERQQAYRELIARGDKIMPEALQSMEAGGSIELYCGLFSALGPDAKTALPKLAERLSDKDHVFMILMTMNSIEPGCFVKLTNEQQQQAISALYEAVLNPGEADIETGYYVSALVELGEPSIPCLLKLLRSKNGEHRRWTADALQGAQFVSDEIKKELTKLVSAPGDVYTRDKALHALSVQGRGKDPQVKAVLLDIIKHPPPPAALRPLVAGQPYARDTTWNDLAYTAALCLSRFGPETIDELLPLLTPTDRPERLPAQTAMERMGEPAIPRLIELLDHKDKSVAQAASMAIGKMQPYRLPKGGARKLKPGQPPPPSASVIALCEALKSENEQVAENSAIALRVGRAWSALPALLEVADDSERSATIRSAAAYAALKIRTKESRREPAVIAAIPSLLDVLDHGTFERQLNAAEALGLIGTPAREALPLLRQRLTLPAPDAETGNIMRDAVKMRAKEAIKAIENDHSDDEG